MQIKDFQQLSKRTLNNDLSRKEQMANMVIGMYGETGEVADIIKKHLYQYHSLDTGHLIEEIGDVMFYISNLCNLFNIDIEHCLEANIEKLKKRYPEGFEAERSINREA